MTLEKFRELTKDMPGELPIVLFHFDPLANGFEKEECFKNATGDLCGHAEIEHLGKQESELYINEAGELKSGEVLVIYCP